jgi:glycosyltransferase involved in cell wall biosynthesis
MREPVYLAANNPDLGGGEQMLVRTAAALVALDRPVTVVAPDAPHEVLDAAASVGADTVAIRADGRDDYLRRLRAWERAERRGLLWCHGLVPALATAGRRGRIVHLHQLPRSVAQRAALVVARAGSQVSLAPSSFLASGIGRSQVFPNWTEDVVRLPERTRGRRIGFMGRLSTDKGADLVARALSSPASAAGWELVVAGDDRWVPQDQAIPVEHALEALGSRAQRLGRVPPEAFFREVDLAVFPSRVAESFGLVVAEAMAAGVPFVISDAGALPEVAGPDHPWVARSGDVDDLARVIRRALEATPAEVRAATDGARRRWEDQYSPQAGRRRVQELLEDVGVGE